MSKHIAAIFAFLLAVTGLNAQQDAQYTMFMYNRQAINPAFAGATGFTNITLLGRAQWVGIPGAPTTVTASANGEVQMLHGGIGGYLKSDKLGTISTLDARLAYAFHLPIGSAGAKLQIGVEGGIGQKGLILPDGGWQYPENSGTDPILPLANTTQIVPDLGAGIYFHLPDPTQLDREFPVQKFYAGVSATHLLEPSLDGLLVSGADAQAKLSRQLFFTAGYTIPVSNNKIKIQPNTFVRTDGASLQFDINTNVYISPMVFGVSHRWKDSFSGIVGFHATTSLFIAYAYDYTTSKLGPFTSGSHELVVSYTFPKVSKRIPVILDVTDY